MVTMTMLEYRVSSPPGKNVSGPAQLAGGGTAELLLGSQSVWCVSVSQSSACARACADEPSNQQTWLGLCQGRTGRFLALDTDLAGRWRTAVVPGLHAQHGVHRHAESFLDPQRHFWRQSRLAVDQIGEGHPAHPENGGRSAGAARPSRAVFTAFYRFQRAGATDIRHTVGLRT